MDNKLVWVIVGVLAIWFLFLRKNRALIVGAAPSSSPYLGVTPKPAIPQPSTAQVALAAGIKAAPQIISALGSFFDDDNDVDTSDDSDD